MRRTLAAAVGLALLFGCARRDGAPPGAADGAPARPAAVRFDTPRGTWVVNVEIARSDEERSRGYMFRKDIPRDTGMLFLFTASDDHTFWMRNTFVSLDMIFLDEDRKVVGVVANAPPQSDSIHGIGKPSRYVLEVAGGEAYAHAVGPGVRAVFVNVPE